MAPLAMATAHSPVKGVSYAVSYGVAFFSLSLAMAVAYFACVCAYRRRVVLPPLHLRVALLPSAIAGTVWNAGNICAMIASLSPLGMSQGFTLTQLCIIVSALWGIFWYREITGVRNLVIFGVSTLVIACGALLLGFFG
eukprot:TRINITY_DN418_c0_g2_i1.p3 TRINITY_DN418_c0_g2~~TRINITY_DN418_c0_g2_i1.p3  ORF type:complete len:139 (-),score=41.77 TRINITY_DN418_c0_g2_i1:85-501(-)